MIKTLNSIDKIMTSGGPETSRVDLNEFVKVADAEKHEADALNALFEAIQEKFKNEREAGETFNSWLNRTPTQELIKISLANGGKVVDLAAYRKSKEPEIKEINLSDFFDVGRTMHSLSQSERETLKWLLNRTLYPKK